MVKFCGKRTLIGFIAVIDMMFGTILFTLHIRQLLFFYVDPYTNDFSPPSLRLLVLFPMTLNAFQVLVAYHLLLATRKVDPFRSLAKSTMWFQTAGVILTFLGFKLFLMIFFSIEHGNDALAMTLVLAEIIFKSFSMYTVKEFLNDLKSLVDYPPASVHFYTVHVPPTSPSPNFSSSPACTGTGSPENNQNFNALNFPNYMNRPGSGSVSPTPVFV